VALNVRDISECRTNYYVEAVCFIGEEMTSKLRKILFFISQDELQDISYKFELSSSGRRKARIERILNHIRRMNTDEDVAYIKNAVSNIINKHHKDELQELCNDINIESTGTKIQLAHRIIKSLEWPITIEKVARKQKQDSPTEGRRMPNERKVKEKPIVQYEHKDKERVNNPPVGLVTPETDNGESKKGYAYDEHFDPQLLWTGKAERTSFDVPTVSLHVHERIDPRTIIEAVRKKNGKSVQTSLFEYAEENPPLREAIEFYKHKHNWSNRLIAGDSLLVMNSLLEKEGMAGKVQMIYIDPPYGIKYGSNFQPFVGKTSMKSTDNDEDLTAEPEMLKAFRDTWELGIHSYLSYLRDRITLSKELLSDRGSIFVQISEENVHRVRLILDELFGCENFISQITIKRASVMFKKKLLNNAVFFVLWYAKSKDDATYNQLYSPKDLEWFAESSGSHLWVEDKKTGHCRKVTSEERSEIEIIAQDNKVRFFSTLGLSAQGTEKQDGFEFEGKKYYPPRGTQWKTSYNGLSILSKERRLIVEANTVRYKVYYDDYPVLAINSLWERIGPASNKIFIVQTPDEIIKRCVLMTTQPGDLVFDPTCGSGTTAYVSEKWGRRWMTCDTSRVAVALTKQRLMTSIFDYYELAYPIEGVGSGFRYQSTPHITLTSITNNEPPDRESLIDNPIIDSSRVRVSGPFTVEAVPSPTVKSFNEVKADIPADKSVAREGGTLRQNEWKDELSRTGIRGKGGQKIEFSRLETFSGTHWIHCDGETKEKDVKRAVVSFGPEHSPLDSKQVARVIEEAQKLVPKPKIVIFASFQFDPEAAKDIDETDWPGVTLLKVQMNADLQTEDLKKARWSNESFWLIGQPDVAIKKINSRNFQIEVKGFDYYNIKEGKIESGGADRIAMWLLDTDYDGRSIFPRQVFFPLAREDGGWARLAKSLMAEIDQDLIEAYRGTVSLPFDIGGNKRIAVKIIDDRGIESLKIIEV